MDFIEVSKELIANDNLSVNSDEWVDDWEEYYVIFAVSLQKLYRELLRIFPSPVPQWQFNIH